MNFHDKSVDYVINKFNSNKNLGLSKKYVKENTNLYGTNVLTKKKKTTFFGRLASALSEPMLIILIFSFLITVGTNLGQYLKSGQGDLTECLGILFAIILSVSITLIMEGSSEKAFNALSKIYQNITVKVIREGKVEIIPQSQVVVGDIIILESGDKIVADGRLIESVGLSVDESALTGESHSGTKEASLILNDNVSLAERRNSVYSGTFITAGNGKMIVTSVGNSTEMGKIAGELNQKQKEDSPLQQKLSKLGKTITLIGLITSIVVFVVSAIRLIYTGKFNYFSVQELFISSIVLIVAAVPEGLPTIVAVSLALNMIKLAKEKALIKKMIATETTGAVSVICSDKTGTLTQNKMTVLSVCKSTCQKGEEIVEGKGELPLLQNFICNSTADIIGSGKNKKFRGSGTECALIDCLNLNKKGVNYLEFRKQYKVLNRIPFSSDKKFMVTQIETGNKNRTLIKGASEKILPLCNISQQTKQKIIDSISKEQKKARRIICFAHRDEELENFNKFSKDKLENIEQSGEFVFDGYAVLFDPVRPDVYNAIRQCLTAGIEVKILTGDNQETALAIATELGLCKNNTQVILASELEKLSENQLIETLKKVSVIARSTPLIKLKVVRALKMAGEVVAVTGDGINDAPAIKHADVGISMGISGSEITKEASDIVLLDDSFSTVVKAVAFGRNVYRNLQRFILFQLSVNLSALLYITITTFMGFENPFNTLQLLWINIIMDGPPAITLGLEKASDSLMNLKPVKKSQSIVSVKMMVRILFNGVFVALILILQSQFNILNVESFEMKGVVFTLFILFQLFNAFNSRGLGAESIFKGFSKNKVMIATFAFVFLLHLLIVQVFPSVFGINSLTFLSWIKCIGLSFSIIIFSELYKWVYRIVKQKKIQKININ